MKFDIRLDSHVMDSSTSLVLLCAPMTTVGSKNNLHTGLFRSVISLLIMRFIIFDLEATCWKDERRPAETETIEIGAVELDGNGAIQSEFDCFIKPVVHPQLTKFCRDLTSIAQSDVDGAETFAAAFARFVEWAKSDGSDLTLVSWGDFDPRQLQVDCTRAGVDYPASFARHVNIKIRFGEARGIKPVGMARALKMLEFPLSGTHHRGIDDARNIAAIAQTMMAQLSEFG